MPEQGGHIIDAFSRLLPWLAENAAPKTYDLLKDSWGAAVADEPTSGDGPVFFAPSHKAEGYRPTQQWYDPRYFPTKNPQNEPGLGDQTEDMIPGQDWAKLAGKAGLKAGAAGLAPLAGLVGNQSRVQGMLRRLWPNEVKPAEKQFSNLLGDKPPQDILNSLIDAFGIERNLPARNELVRTLHNVGMTRDLNEKALPLLGRANWSDLAQHRVTGAPNLSQLDASTVLATPGPAGHTLRDTFRLDLSKSHPIDMNNLLGAYLPEANTTLFPQGMPKTYLHETGHRARNLIPDQPAFDEMLRELGAANPISMQWLENRPFYAKQPFPKRAEELFVRLNAGQPVPGEREIPRGYESLLDEFNNFFGKLYQPDATRPAGFPTEEALWSASNTAKDLISPGGWR